ncbi:Peptidyl-prolyl cis-trans isomerase cyclophilin-type [Neofusicoccum parvum]|uniref:Peptidyl-prolyl cis-trans isomerase cyclophilin-type n=2 Tax=Neofusicoccum parvum TaxID=310453 RepID=A0ACB5RPH2_9PEZI|nr:putative beta-flanking protein [Neofusicoccum parvum UCRNP2]GME22397.1 Peptidyl-prolyl cis-trans isomerase cyclophilin-type [Neofusicoccum parvum]GME64664.1 Peptidyl-prolyl cis-trans isomerase cyclophilin-type [Neofusicoccum parvum]
MSYEHRGGERDDYYSSKRYDDSDDEDYKHAERRAAEHGSGDSSLFSQALGMLSGKKQSLKEEDLDEDDAVRQHKTYYGGGHESSSQATEGNLGAAAAMQALKMFNSGEGKSSSKGEFLGLAMAQASKLFDEQSANGKTDPSASKQGAVQQAAQMALKMYLKSDQGGSSGGSKPSGLMGLASKFL